MWKSVARYEAESRRVIWSSEDGIKEEREEMSQDVRDKEKMSCNAEETKEISEDIQHFQNQIKKERSLGTTGTRPTIDIGAAGCCASLAGKLLVSGIGPYGKEREKYAEGNSDID